MRTRTKNKPAKLSKADRQLHSANDGHAYLRTDVGEGETEVVLVDDVRGDSL